MFKFLLVTVVAVVAPVAACMVIPKAACAGELGWPAREVADQVGICKGMDR